MKKKIIISLILVLALVLPFNMALASPDEGLKNVLIISWSGAERSIVKELLKQQHRVRVIDNLSTGNLKNIEPFLARIEFFESDLTSFNLDKLSTIKNLNCLMTALRKINF